MEYFIIVTKYGEVVAAAKRHAISGVILRTHWITHTDTFSMCMCAHRLTVTNRDRSFHRASKHDAMFAEVRQHFILSSARSVEKAPKNFSLSLSASLRLASTHLYVCIFERAGVCTSWKHMCGCACGSTHRVEELSVPIRRRRRKRNSERGSKYWWKSKKC